MLGPETIVVVGETPSLARSITDLLESDGFSVTTVGDPLRELTRSLRNPLAPVSLVITASNGHHCETARRWMRGEVSGVTLVVVGCRDPEVRPGPRVRVIGLPLAPEEFLQLVRRLLERPPVTLTARRSRAPRRPDPRPPRLPIQRGLAVGSAPPADRPPDGAARGSDSASTGADAAEAPPRLP